MSAWVRGAAALSALGCLFFAQSASAYCRTYSCDPTRVDCALDQNLCVVGGKPLTWPTSCIGFAVQRNGSPRHGISAERLEKTVEASFAPWLNANCGGGRKPEISVESLGTVSCDKPEYNQDYGNANIILFRDDDWPPNDSGHALALTTLWFNPDTGSIYDVDIEVNGTVPAGMITAGSVQEGIDLQSILTHEIGHFLGLSHSENQRAVMRPYYEPGVDDLRSLHADDVAGICAIYPPDRPVTTTSCRPRHGFASDCRGADDGGCSVARVTSESSGRLSLWLAAAALGAARLRRSRSASTRRA